MSGCGQKHSFVQNRLPSFVFTKAGEKKKKKTQLNVVEMQREQLRNQLPFKKELKFGIIYIYEGAHLSSTEAHAFK